MLSLTNRDAEQVFKGRVGKAAQYSAEHDVVNVNIAVTRSWPNRDWQEGDDPQDRFFRTTQWYQVAHWKRDADKLALLDKGDIVEVSFHAADLKPDVYVTGEGEPAASLKIERGTIRLLESKSTAAAPASEPEPEHVTL
jgi:hypothetical protein